MIGDRSDAGLKPLTWNYDLEKLATDHTKQIGDNDCQEAKAFSKEELKETGENAFCFVFSWHLSECIFEVFSRIPSNEKQIFKFPVITGGNLFFS